MADLIFNNYFESLLNAVINHSSDTLKVALVEAAYTPDRDNHDFFDDVTNEITGTGYTAGGETLAGKAVTQDDTNNEGKFDATDTAWTTATFTARGAVLYKDTGVDTTSPIICYFDFGSDKVVTAGTFTIQWHADGILTIGDA